MLAQVIWYSGVLLEAIVILRGLRGRLLHAYPVFYSYLFAVLAVGLARLSVLRWLPKDYAQVYWDTQFLSLVIGCMVIFEIYRAGLKDFPGAARMARNLLLFVFAIVFAKAVVTSPNAGAWWSALTAVKLERDLRVVQGSALLALVALLLIYSIPVGKNLKGIVVGYGIFLVASVLQLTLMVHLGGGFAQLWAYLRSAAYLLSLMVWLVALWSHQEAPRPAHSITLDDDYNMLVASTRRKFEKTRLALGKVVRP